MGVIKVKDLWDQLSDIQFLGIARTVGLFCHPIKDRELCDQLSGHQLIKTQEHEVGFSFHKGQEIVLPAEWSLGSQERPRTMSLVYHPIKDEELCDQQSGHQFLRRPGTKGLVCHPMKGKKMFDQLSCH